MSLAAVGSKGFQVSVIADSINKATKSRLLTVALRYPRFIHSELMTHRVFSRNASSSRAIPVMTTLKRVWNDPAMPLHWGANRKGMQAKEELTGWRRWAAEAAWRLASKVACVFAYVFVKIGLHKQIANRILEPWQWMETLVTASEWDNFFTLRCHPDAQPEFQFLANLIRKAHDQHTPRELKVGEWHLPFTEYAGTDSSALGVALIRSAAMCAWVSYKMPDGAEGNWKACISTFTKLTGDPLHASPLEHQAQATYGTTGFNRNFEPGWAQHRALREYGDLYAEEML